MTQPDAPAPEHSPTPWTADADIIKDATGRIIGQMGVANDRVTKTTLDEDDANAARAVLAVNAHETIETLVEALADACANLAGATSAYEKFVGRHNRRGFKDALYETRIRDFEKAIERARTALALARGAAP